MTAYIVSYDLKKPGRDFQPLWDRLAQWKATRVLESLWLIDTNPDWAIAIRDDLKQYIDGNDWLFVARLNGETAWTGSLWGLSAQYLLKLFGGK
jgi:hypothetical protein